MGLDDSEPILTDGQAMLNQTGHMQRHRPSAECGQSDLLLRLRE